MTETPDRAAIHARARARAERMGLASPEQPEEEPAPPVLPKRLTDHPGALRAMLATGHLTEEQAAAARTFLADHAAEERLSAPIHHFPEDAA